MPSSAHDANLRFWLFTVGLLAVWAVVIASGAPPPTSEAASINSTKSSFLASPLADNEVKNSRNCKALCDHCGCLPFYCGEECICECNNENTDTECIAKMQRNARKLDIPFEILLQGPSENCFVRKALQYEQDEERKSINAANQIGDHAAGRNKRSTVVIYKPTAQNTIDIGHGELHKGSIAKQEAVALLRHKRTVSHLDWFSDFANTLVRPAPLGSQRKNEPSIKAEETPAYKRATADQLDRSWFSDNTPNLLRPAPLFRRSQSSTDNQQERQNRDFRDRKDNRDNKDYRNHQRDHPRDSSDSDESQSLSITSAVEKLPQVLKDTIRNIQESALNEQFGDALRNRFRDHTATQNRMQQQNFELLPEGTRESLRDMLASLNSQIFRNDMGAQPQQQQQPPLPPPTSAPRMQPKMELGWFRPVRFLHRVQDAIN